MKHLDFSIPAGAIKPEAWESIKEDPLLKQYEDNAEKVGAFIHVIAGQAGGRQTMNDFRNSYKAIEWLKDNLAGGDIPEDQFKMLHTLFNEIAPKFMVRVGAIILPIADYLDEVAK